VIQGINALILLKSGDSLRKVKKCFKKCEEVLLDFTRLLKNNLKKY
jgi:hypothetical protein